MANCVNTHIGRQPIVSTEQDNGQMPIHVLICEHNALVAQNNTIFKG